MLYQAYQAHCDAFAPVRLMAETARGWLSQPFFNYMPVARGAHAAMTMLSQAGISHQRPEFGIERVTVGGRRDRRNRGSRCGRLRSAGWCGFRKAAAKANGQPNRNC